VARIIITLIDIDTIDESVNVQVETDTRFPDDQDDWTPAMCMAALLLQTLHDTDDTFEQHLIH